MLPIAFLSSEYPSLFCRLDPQGKGYIEFMDWGNKEIASVVEKFTRLFMMIHMGLPGLISTGEEVRKYYRNQCSQQVSKNVVQ